MIWVLLGWALNAIAGWWWLGVVAMPEAKQSEENQRAEFLGTAFICIFPYAQFILALFRLWQARGRGRT